MPEGTLAFGDENELAARIREVLGVGPYKDIRFGCLPYGFKRTPENKS